MWRWFENTVELMMGRWLAATAHDYLVLSVVVIVGAWLWGRMHR